MLSDRHSMAGRKTGAQGASRIDNGMASDERIRTDQRRWIIIRGLLIIGRQGFSHHSIVTDDRVVTNLNIVINGGVVPDFYVPADSSVLADVNISAIELHTIGVLNFETRLCYLGGGNK
jgi:hypothetical protein